MNCEVLVTQVDFVNDKILTYEPSCDSLDCSVMFFFVVAFYTVYSSCSLRAAYVDGKSVYLRI